MSALLISGTSHCSRLDFYTLPEGNLVDHGSSVEYVLWMEHIHCSGLTVLRCCAVAVLRNIFLDLSTTYNIGLGSATA